MQSHGLFARRNDIFTQILLGLINAGLQSRIASACMLVVLMFLIGTLCPGLSIALIWNLSRLGRDEPSLVAPGWPETSRI